MRSLLIVSLFTSYLLFGAQAQAIAPEDLFPPEQAYPLTAAIDPSGQVSLNWHIAEGYYLYRSKFKFSSDTPGIIPGDARFPPGEIKHDDFFGDMEIYRGHLHVDLPLTRQDSSVTAVTLTVSIQGCADAGVCFPPYKRQVTLNFPAADAATPSAVNPLEKLLAPKVSATIPEADLLPPDQAFHFIAEAKDAHTLRVSWQIAPGYYLYRDRFKFALHDSPAASLGTVVFPAGTMKEEENGPREVFHHELAVDLPIERSDTAPATLTLWVKFQGCAEKGVCYPPMEKTVALDVPAVSANPLPSGKGHSSTTLAVTEQRSEKPEQDRIADSLKTDSLGVVCATFFGFGLLMAFSPCLFPMIPILSGIVAGHGHKITAAKAFWLSFVYVLAGAVTYTAFGVLAGLFGGNLQAAFQNPWIIGSFAALFVILSLAMFDFYALQMPAFIQERVASISHKQQGGTFVGAAIMGALSALIVGPCMAAPLAGALIYIGQTGDALLGGAALFAMGMGMGVPLMVIGTSAGKLLPKAGVWMNAVKAVFGVGLLAVAVSLLERIVPPAVTLALWSLLLIVPAVYLSALDPLPHPCSGWRKFWKGIGVAMLSYGLLLLIGAASNSSDPLQPLRGLSAAAPASQAPKTEAFKRVMSLEELDRGLAAAKSQGRWALVDFYADWCTSCKEMERYTFGDPAVQAAMAGMVLLQVDVTGNDDREQALLKRYQLIGPPATLFFGPDGVERQNHRLVGQINAQQFLELLARVKS
jgi:thiol:disulfide interchange protein DsbD